MRKYSRVEKTTDITITEFDGEGFISPRLAEALGREHNSFQIRMPYIKGVVHKVNFSSLFDELNVPYIVDMWGERHDPTDVDIILTDSMFKGRKWMESNNLSWGEYLNRCAKYGHALYDRAELSVLEHPLHHRRRISSEGVASRLVRLSRVR